jgi:hypothetical protein
MHTSLAKTISRTIAEKYEQQHAPDTEIHLIQNEGNNGGHCKKRCFKKNILYKIVFPTPLSSLNHFMAVIVTTYREGKSEYMGQNHGSILTIYDEYSVDFCFFLFFQDVECSFFTNLH